MEFYGIDPKEISVIVRGLIVGNDVTKRALASFRTHLPGAQIILSSWKESDVSGLDYDDLVLSDQPKGLFVALSDGKPKAITVNNQIVTTQNGIAKARGKYLLVTRSDIMLTDVGFLKYFSEYNKDGGGVLKKKVVVLPTYNPRRNVVRFLYNTCDWFFFGTKEDITDIFSIPLMDEKNFMGEKINGLFSREENFGAEQYVWSTFLRKHQPVDLPSNHYFSPEALTASEMSYAKNTIMVPADRAGLICLKMPHAGYGARPVLSQGLYTFNEYRKMYNAYNEHKVPFIPNPLENLLYAILLRTRLLIKSMDLRIYKKITNFVRRRNGSNDLLS
jgi:hypothetical protein